MSGIERESYAWAVLEKIYSKRNKSFRVWLICPWKGQISSFSSVTFPVYFAFTFNFAFEFKGFRRYVQAAKRQAVWLSRICNKWKILWALPTPTTFEKVDQTFIFGTESFAFSLLYCPTDNLINHNLLQLLTKNLF